MRKPGGRPKAEDIWEHVTVLPGGKQVECKYCKFVFAASANRIKHHIDRTKGKGVRICPKSEKSLRDLKEKEDLPDSQGLLILDKSRDYNKPHETLIDCYMSPKTMWEGINAIQQVRTNNNEAIHQERIEVGPFYVSYILNERALQLSSLDPVRKVKLIGIDYTKVIPSGSDLGNRDINKLIVTGCDHWRRRTCLYHTSGSFEKLEIDKSNKLEYLCCMSAHCSFCHSVQLVGTLCLFWLKDLKQIVAPHTTPPWASPFVHLTHLDIFESSIMKIVMTPELLAQLQNLETICVGCCESMEEIVGENYCSGNTSNPTIITLPKLTSLELVGLPKLNSVFRGTMHCPSLKSFVAYDCEKISPPDIEIVEGHKLHLEIRRGRYIWPYDPIEDEEEEEEEEEEGEEDEDEDEEEYEDYLVHLSPLIILQGSI